MEKGVRSEVIQGIDYPDILLWAVWSLQQYAKETSLEHCTAKYGTLITEIVDYIIKSKHPNLFLHENGLLYIHGWMR